MPTKKVIREKQQEKMKRVAEVKEQSKAIAKQKEELATAYKKKNQKVLHVPGRNRNF